MVRTAIITTVAAAVVEQRTEGPWVLAVIVVAVTVVAAQSISSYNNRTEVVAAW